MSLDGELVPPVEYDPESGAWSAVASDGASLPSGTGRVVNSAQTHLRTPDQWIRITVGRKGKTEGDAVERA